MIKIPPPPRTPSSPQSLARAKADAKTRAQRRPTGELKGKAKERYDFPLASGIAAPAALPRVRAGGSWPSNSTVLARLRERLQAEEALQTRYKEFVIGGGDPARAWAYLHTGHPWPGLAHALAALGQLGMTVHIPLPPRPDQMVASPQAAPPRTHTVGTS